MYLILMKYHLGAMKEMETAVNPLFSTFNTLRALSNLSMIFVLRLMLRRMTLFSFAQSSSPKPNDCVRIRITKTYVFPQLCTALRVLTKSGRLSLSIDSAIK